MFPQGIEQCRTGVQHKRMRLAVDLKLDFHWGRGRPVVTGRAGRKSGARQRGQQQRGGSGLDDRAPGYLNCVEPDNGFWLVHECSVFAWPAKTICGKASEAYDLVLSCPREEVRLMARCSRVR